MQVIPGWDFVPILCYSDVNPGCQVLTYSLPPMWSVLQSQERIFWYFLVPFLVPKSHQNLKHFLTSFLSYRVTHFILSFNCTKHTSLNHKLLKKKYHWPKNVMAGTLETSTAFAYTHTHTFTHAHIWFQFQMPFLIYFSRSSSHTIVFLSLLNLALPDHSHRVQIGQWIATCHQHN